MPPSLRPADECHLAGARRPQVVSVTLEAAALFKSWKDLFLSSLRGFARLSRQTSFSWFRKDLLSR